MDGIRRRPFRRQLDGLSAQDRYHFYLVANQSNRDVERLTRAEHELRPSTPIVDAQQASKTFRRIADKILADINGRPVEDVDVAVIYIDAMKVRGVDILWALGVTSDGDKFVVRIADQGGETKSTARGLIDGMIDEQKLDVTDVVWVTDGGPATDAIKDRLGSLEHVQRCTLHKKRNIVRDNLSAEEKVGIGLRLVREQLAGQRNPDVPVVPRFQMTQLGLALGLPGPPTANDLPAQVTKDKHKNARKTLLNIGERALRARYAEAMKTAEHAAAGALLEAHTRWLDAWELNSAAGSLREGLEETLTVTRLGMVGMAQAIEQEEADAAKARATAGAPVRGKAKPPRRPALTNNPNEGPHAPARRVVDRTTHMRDFRQRQRHFAMGLARAEQGWQPAFGRRMLLNLSAQVVLQRHEPGIELEEVGTRDIVFKSTDSIDGDTRSPAVDAVLEDFRRWADRKGQRMVVPTPASPARAEWLADRGFLFDEQERALVRLPGVVGAASPERAQGGRQALEVVSHATGGDRELVGAVAEHAAEIVGKRLHDAKGKLPDATILARELAGVHAAADALGPLREEVAAWFATAKGPAAEHAAEAWVRFKEQARDPLYRLRRAVLTGAQADELMAAVAHQVPLVQAQTAAQRDAIRARHADTTTEWLVTHAKRIDAAAQAVASGHLLDLRHELDRAKAASAEHAPERGTVQLRDEQRTPYPVAGHAGGLGARRHAALAACRDGGRTLVGKLNDATLVALDRRLGEPFAALKADAAAPAAAREDQVLMELQRRRWQLMRSSGECAAAASIPGRAQAWAKPTADRAAWLEARAREVAEEQYRVRAQIEALHERPGSAHALMFDALRLALHDAVVRELAQRGLEHTRPDLAAEERARADRLDANAQQAAERARAKKEQKQEQVTPLEEQPVDLMRVMEDHRGREKQAVQPPLLAPQADLADAGGFAR